MNGVVGCGKEAHGPATRCDAANICCCMSFLWLSTPNTCWLRFQAERRICVDFCLSGHDPKVHGHVHLMLLHGGMQDDLAASSAYAAHSSSRCRHCVFGLNSAVSWRFLLLVSGMLYWVPQFLAREWWMRLHAEGYWPASPFYLLGWAFCGPATRNAMIGKS